MEDELFDAIYEVVCDMQGKDAYWYMRSIYLSAEEIDWYYYGKPQYSESDGNLMDAYT